MSEYIKKVESIKGAIEAVLEVIRDIYRADVCALFLIMDQMDEDEQLEILEKRARLIKARYAEKGENPPAFLVKYFDAVDDKKNLSETKETLKKFRKNIDVLKFCFKEVQNPKITEGILYPEKNGRIWKYDYKKENRPPKWVIFKEYKDAERESSIMMEGITAFSIRTKQEIFINSLSDFEKYKCATLFQSYKGITPRSKMSAFLHLTDENERIIGLVKIENYDEYEEIDRLRFREDGQETREARAYLPLLVKLVREARFFYEEYSYERLYGGIQLLPLLKQIQPIDGSLNQKIHDLTQHLFSVLFRKEYVGHEEIMTRITNFADDLADELSVSKSDLFKTLLDRRRQHEELMLYKTKGYRDHFMHQFHVFVTGYILLNFLGLLNPPNFSRPNPKSKLHESSKIPSREFSCDSILTIWFLTAFMHDAAYVFERFDEGTAKFLREEWGYDFTLKLSGSQFFFKELPFTAYLVKIIEEFSCPNKITNKAAVWPFYLDSLVRLNDHGVLSALWLVETFSKGTSGLRKIESYTAAFAVSCHNQNIFRHLKEENEAGISFESFSFAFLLAFCDTIQIWGRTRELSEDVNPQLHDIKYNKSKNEIIVQLFYQTNYPDRIPDFEYIRAKLVQDKDAYFRSSQYKFKIEFYGGSEWNPKSNPIDTVLFSFSGT